MRSLSPRERTLFVVAVVCIGLLLGYLIVFRGYIGGIKRLEQRIEVKRQELAELEKLWNEYRYIKTALPSLESKLAKKDFSLLAELEDLAGKAGVKDNIDFMREFPKPQNEFYREFAVRLKLKRITLDQLVSYLYCIEHGDTLLRAKSLVVERSYGDPDLLDVQMEVSAFSYLSASQRPSGGTS
ncbi:MAG TPA: hypothetical protein ENF73_01650 [Proteobacteria bacterium]|nr:hypothetical protein [Pseudomonadota bacterium]